MQQPVARRLVVLAAVLVAGCGGAPHRHAARATAAGPTNRCASARAHFAVRHTVTPLLRRSAITGALRRLDPEAWFPAGRRCRAPLIVMSHGHNGAPAACARLCEHLASLGFVVLAPRHADAGTPVRLQAAERVDDLTYVLDHLRRLAPRPVDRRAIGVTGHSFGGRTAVELAAQDPRVKAVVTMAGGADRATTATVTAPTLMLAGGGDRLDPPILSIRSGRALPRSTPHRVIVVPGVGHRALGNAPAAIRATSAWLLAELVAR